MFEEEYNDILSSMQREIGDEDYIRYLDAISAHDTLAGYFSVDKKGKMTDSKLSDKKEGTSDDNRPWIVRRGRAILDSL